MLVARFCARGLLLLLLSVAVVLPAGAAPPLAGLLPFQRIDADPQQSYPLSEENGPWLIMVTTLQGPQAEEQARQLVYELRKKYKLTAYTHKMTFDRSATVGGRGLDRYGNRQRMRNRQGGTGEEVAVLVGNYQSVDNEAVQQALEKIKSLRPTSLEGNGADRGQTQQEMEKPSFDELRDRVMPDGKQRKKQGPLRMAFVTTNPLLPETYYHPKGVDKVVEDMNRGVKHSLLECPSRFTVRVATFNGNVVIDPKRLEQIAEQPERMRSRLMEAAEKAHDATVFLRAIGYEAYEYHDRHSSIVTVGGYDAPGQVHPGGGFVFSPDVQETIDRFRAKPVKYKNGSVGPVTPMQIQSLKIYLDPQPMLIEVPRRSFGSDYARSMTHE